MKKSLFLCLSLLIMAAPGANAQFLKKLGKKVSDKVENAVTRNISDKAAKEADDALNDMWDTKFENMNVGLGSPVDEAKIPNSYDFNWKYSMQAETKDGNKIDFVYRLKNDAKYMGMELPNAQNMFIVVDNENEMTVMYINGMVRATKLDLDDLSDEVEKNSDDEYANMEFKKIASKNILGYNCDGYEAENDEYIMTMYVTDEAGVGFASLYDTQKNLPKGFKPEWLNKDALMMEMNVKDKKKPKNSMRMTCTGVTKENFSISK